MNAVTFGQLSAFYQYMPNDVQVKVSKHFPGYTEKQLHQFITIIAKCRNVCAHGERLYDFRTQDTIPDTLLHQKLSIPLKKGSYTLGKHDLFAVVLSLRYLINNDDFKSFKRSLIQLIKRVLKQCPHLTQAQLLKQMGFPENWEKICRYCSLRPSAVANAFCNGRPAIPAVTYHSLQSESMARAKAGINAPLTQFQPVV